MDVNNNNNNCNNYNNGMVDMEVDSEHQEKVDRVAAAEKRDNHDENNNNSNKDDNNPFECSICLDMANYPIVTCCGHLFCHPCFSSVQKPSDILGRQLHAKSIGRQCPVCKGVVKDSAINPIHVNNSKEKESPSDCGICLRMASDPIVTICGHLFCWACFFRAKLLYENGQFYRECPVCKGEAKESDITPIYVNNNNNQKRGESTGQEEKWVPLRRKAHHVKRGAAAQQRRYIRNSGRNRIISMSILSVGERLFLEKVFSRFDRP